MRRAFDRAAVERAEREVLVAAAMTRMAWLIRPRTDIG